MKPLVAIIGRPNVGKSTLFNRIVGSRKAVTHDTPGVTRDRNYAPAEWGGREFVCIDTGGFPLDKESLDEEVSSQIDLAIAGSDCIICVFDGQAGPIPEEKDIVDRLRKSKKSVLYVVNKIDTPQHELDLSAFYQLGVQDVMPVSAEHGYQVAEMLDSLKALFPEEEKTLEPVADEIQVAVVGRPNVGKSSLVNALLGQARVVVDDKPGTTVDAIDTPFHLGKQACRLVDTAGMRRRPQKGGHLERVTVLQSLRAIDRAEICLLVIAADEKITAQDAHIAGYIEDRGRALIIIWNKIDLVPDIHPKEFMVRTQDALPFLREIPMVQISAKEGTRVDDIFPHVLEIHREMEKRIPTAHLNSVMAEQVANHNLPMYKGKEMRVYYVTQVGIRPPTFIVFVNYPDGVLPSYKRYLIRVLQDRLGFSRVPLRIIFRRRT